MIDENIVAVAIVFMFVAFTAAVVADIQTGRFAPCHPFNAELTDFYDL